MHILLAILAVAVGVGIWIWRIQVAARAATDLLDTADDVRAAVRRFGFRRKSKASPLDGIEDSRLAAAGILAAFANMDGGLGREEIDSIARECSAAFHCDSTEGKQISAYGRWLISYSNNMDEAVRRLARNLEGKLTEAEKDQLMGMIERVASIDGGELTDGQRYTLGQLARQLN